MEYSLLLLGLSVAMYIKSKNIIVTLIIFFYMAFLVNVTLVDLMFESKGFSPRADLFDSISLIEQILSIFVFIVFIVNYKIDTNIVFIRRTDTRIWDFILFIAIVILSVYLYQIKGMRLDGSFSDSKNLRFIIEDYLYVIIAAAVIYFRAGKIVLLSVFILAMIYMLGGERMRMFVLLGSIYFAITDKQHGLKFKIGLFVVLGLAISIDILRSIGVEAVDYHISHFGSVTISSQYLIEFMEGLTVEKKIDYLHGILLANFIPSSLLSEGFDIRRDLFQYANIPGGGWLPVWFYGLFGYFGLVVFSVVFSLLIRFISLKLDAYKDKGEKFGYCPKMHLYGVFFVVLVTTLPRWLMYTPYQVLRFPLYAVIILLSLYLINYTILKKWKN
jgi:hypothetical protein